MEGKQRVDLLEYKKKLDEKKLSNRKQELEKILMSKRIRSKEVKQKNNQKIFVSEVLEDFRMDHEPKNFLQAEDELEEVTKGKGKLNLNLHYKKKRAPKDKKKCWKCYSPYHLKKSCPYIRCFFCKKLGHMKCNCMSRKISFVFNRLKERFRVKEMKKKEKKETEKKKVEQKELEKKIMILRASYLDFVQEKGTEGEIFKAKWKGIDLGDYEGPGLPSIAIKNILEHRYKFKYLNVLVDKDLPSKSLTLYEHLSNWCGCGEIDAEKNFFLKHVKLRHKGLIPRNSQINRYPWLDWINFKDPNLEFDFCHTLSDLKNYN